MKGFLMSCRTRRNIFRATATALVVGPLLVLINQTEALAGLFDGETLPPLTMMRISLTFLVPFVVSLSSSSLADAQRNPTE